MRFEVPTAVKMLTLVYWVVTPCAFADTNISKKHTVFFFTAWQHNPPIKS
jgi:hypothetical protein